MLRATGGRAPHEGGRTELLIERSACLRAKLLDRRGRHGGSAGNQPEELSTGGRSSRLCGRLAGWRTGIGSPYEARGCTRAASKKGPVGLLRPESLPELDCLRPKSRRRGPSDGVRTKSAGALRRAVHARPPAAHSSDERNGLTRGSLLCLMGPATASLVAWPPRPRRRLHPVLDRVASRGVRRGRDAAPGSTRLSTGGVGRDQCAPPESTYQPRQDNQLGGVLWCPKRAGRGRACRGSPQREGRVARPGGCSERRSTGGHQPCLPPD